MKIVSIFLIFSAFLISCSTAKTSNPSETLLGGDWYGGPGTKYSVSGNKKEWIQDLPASNTPFVYGIWSGSYFHPSSKRIQISI